MPKTLHFSQDLLIIEAIGGSSERSRSEADTDLGAHRNIKTRLLYLVVRSFTQGITIADFSILLLSKPD
jgi:hypothetical protein